MHAQPNIILITLHDLGDYLGCYGEPVKTPNIDRIAREGVRFEKHFAASTICSPSRGTIMTGCYPHTHGLMGLVHRGWCLDTENLQTLPELLGQGGYETHLFGFQHEHWDASQLGYGTVHDCENHHIDKVLPEFTNWLRARPSNEEPFFCSLGTLETHRWGYHFESDAYEPVPNEQIRVRGCMPDIPGVREDLRHFYGMIEYVDGFVGSVLDSLDQAGVTENTLLIFTTDHGASLPHSKATLYDGGTKVACAMRWPQKIAPGRKVESLTSHADLLPTLLEWAGLPTPDQCQGKSLAPVVHGDTEKVRDCAFAEENFSNMFAPTRMARTRKWKYIRRGVPSCIYDFQIPEIECSNANWRNTPEVAHFYSAERCTEELYDLEKDPDEMRNIAEEKPEALEEMRRRLAEHMEVTADPFKDFRNDIAMPRQGFAEVLKTRWP